ncbi:uncharacterized protein METZ01_LOCUS15518 [marine metagenome]|uniref:Uncharacterized protein n=1 Tax=marine metagenome TaxID=408172 RepID=A0A381P7T3_9ZZZZ
MTALQKENNAHLLMFYIDKTPITFHNNSFNSCWHSSTGRAADL